MHVYSSYLARINSSLNSPGSLLISFMMRSLGRCMEVPPLKIRLCFLRCVISASLRLVINAFYPETTISLAAERSQGNRTEAD